MIRHLSVEEAIPSAGNVTVSLNAMHAIVNWCEALNGAISLESALSALVSGLGAEAGMIVRTQTHEGRSVRIAQCDLIKDVPVRPLQRSFAEATFGPNIDRARAATIWQATAHSDDLTGDPSLAEWQASRKMKEFVVLVLSAGPRVRDQIELHFRELPSPEIERTIASMLPEMVRVWAGRQVGLITRTIINHRPQLAVPAQVGSRQNILGSDNPSRLSRAEFRVCLLLGSGLMVQAVAKELSLSEPTIRTHLRNIYAKTECSSLAELVFRLMDSRSNQEMAGLRSA